jgi:hypothetical protein
LTNEIEKLKIKVPALPGIISGSKFLSEWELFEARAVFKLSAAKRHFLPG